MQKIKKSIDKAWRAHNLFSERLFLFFILSIPFLLVGKGLGLLFHMHKLSPFVFSSVCALLLIGFAEKAAKRSNRTIKAGSTQAVFFFLKDRFGKQAEKTQEEG